MHGSTVCGSPGLICVQNDFQKGSVFQKNCHLVKELLWSFSLEESGLIWSVHLVDRWICLLVFWLEYIFHLCEQGLGWKQVCSLFVYKMKMHGMWRLFIADHLELKKSCVANLCLTRHMGNTEILLKTCACVLVTNYYIYFSNQSSSKLVRPSFWNISNIVKQKTVSSYSRIHLWKKPAHHSVFSAKVDETNRDTFAKKTWLWSVVSLWEKLGSRLTLNPECWESRVHMVSILLKRGAVSWKCVDHFHRFSCKTTRKWILTMFLNCVRELPLCAASNALCCNNLLWCTYSLRLCFYEAVVRIVTHLRPSQRLHCSCPVHGRYYWKQELDTVPQSHSSLWQSENLPWDFQTERCWRSRLLPFQWGQWRFQWSNHTCMADNFFLLHAFATEIPNDSSEQYCVSVEETIIDGRVAAI